METIPTRRAFKPTANDAWMLLVIVCWGLNLSLIKISLKEISPLPFNAIRLTLASLVLLAMLWKSEGSLKVQKKDWGRLALLSFTGHTLYQYLFIVGFNLTTAANASVILATSPIFLSLFSTFFKHERIRPMGWVGILLAFSGVYVVLAGKSGGFRLASASMKGDLILLAGVSLWAHYSVSSRPMLRIYSPLKFSAITMSFGSLMFLFLSLGSIPSVNFPAITFTAWACLVYSGVLALSVALVIWFTSVKAVGNSQTAVFSNLQPIMAIFFAHGILGERIPPALIMGILLIFIGILFTRWKGNAKFARMRENK